MVNELTEKLCGTMIRKVINELGERVIVMDRSDRGPLTDDERSVIAQLDDVIDEYDEDCSEVPEAMAVQMRADTINKTVGSGAVV